MSFIFAIETCGRTVAFTKEIDRIMLEGILGGGREEEAKELRDGLSSLRDCHGKLWDGVSPITARLATASEELDFNMSLPDDEQQAGEASGESFLMFRLEKNTVLVTGDGTLLEYGD
jgi:hypothetical protein